MKKIKRYLLWFFLLEKRLFRKVGFILVLASVPLLVLVISLISSRAEGAIEVVLFSEEPGDAVVAEITDKLLADRSFISFREVGTRDEAINLVKYGSADEAWILEKGFFGKISAYANGKDVDGPAVSVYVRQDSAALLVAREKLTSAVSPVLLRETMKAIVRGDFDESELPDEEGLNAVFDGAFRTEEIFKYSYLDGGDTADKDIGYLLSPVRGILAVMTVLGGLATGVYWLRDVEAGAFGRFRGARRIILAAGYQLTGVLPVAVVSLISLAVAGVLTDPLREILNSLLLCASASAFCSLVRVICGKSERLSVATPILTIALLALSPIFMGMDTMRVFHVLTPVFYYLSATPDALFLPLTAAYAAAAAALAILLAKLQRFVRKA
ncbi:MAG: hypothetical protein IKN50_05995 [Clostridia bacterium]|nr:hypothetical protein [Clostridia bacterium]